METNHNLPKRPPTNEQANTNNQNEASKSIEGIKNKNITLFEKVESKEVEQIVNNKQVSFNIATYVLALITFFVLFFAVNYEIHATKIVVSILTPLAVIAIGTYIKRKYLKRYYDLLRITRKNDNIRHEEKVRARERERLNKIENEKLTAQNIKNSIKDYDELNK